MTASDYNIREPRATKGDKHNKLMWVQLMNKRMTMLHGGENDLNLKIKFNLKNEA